VKHQLHFGEITNVVKRDVEFCTPCPADEECVGRVGLWDTVRMMRSEIERAYATFIPRVVRKPLLRSAVGKLPVLISFADDLPKHAKRTLSEVTSTADFTITRSY
jgi:hypothetical protein